MILYKSLFVLFYQIGAGQWPSALDADVHKGVIGVTLFEAIIALSIGNLFEVELQRRATVSHWLIWLFFGGILWLNYFILVSRRVGIDFLPEFHGYSERRRRLIYAMASVSVIAVGFLFYYSVQAVHRVILPT